MTLQAGDADGAVLNVRAARDAGSATITLEGELDLAGIAELESCADALLSPRPTDVDVDVGGLTFCDATGIGALVRIRNQVCASGHRLRLVDVPECVQRLLDVLEMQDCFD